MRSRSLTLDDQSAAPTSSAATITDRAVRVADFKGAGGVGARPAEKPISVFKVFSATKARDREDIGERVSAWIASNPDIEIKKTVVCLSSDSQFHCLSFVLIGCERPAP